MDALHVVIAEVLSSTDEKRKGSNVPQVCVSTRSVCAICMLTQLLALCSFTSIPGQFVFGEYSRDTFGSLIKLKFF